MRRVLPLLTLCAAVAVLVVGLGTALTAETPDLPAVEGNGTLDTAAPISEPTPSKWVETDHDKGNGKSKGKKRS